MGRLRTTWNRRLVASFALALVGCAPAPLTNGPFIQQGGGQLISPDSTHPAYAPSATWSPRFGRMGTYLQQRHLRVGEVAAAHRGSTRLLAEGFEAFTPESPDPWEVLGSPMLRVHQTAPDNAYLEFGAPLEPGLHGIQRSIAGEMIRNSVVRVRLGTWMTSAARVRYLGAPQIRWVVATTDGRRETVSLPFIGRASPAWEEQTFLTWFDETVQWAWLQIVHVDRGASFGFDNLVVERLSPDSFAWMTLPYNGTLSTSDSPEGSPNANFLPNGNFEVGAKGLVVWSEQDWPGRGAYAAPTSWQFSDETPIGNASLLVNDADVPAYISLGPFELAEAGARRPAEQYHLSFYARASAPAEVTVEWRICGIVVRARSFQVGMDWGRHRHIFLTPAAVRGAPQGRYAATELVFRITGTAQGQRPSFWLDGVSLGSARTEDPYPPPSPVEVGIIGPAPHPTDLGDLVLLGEPAAIAVHLLNYQGQAYTGTVAMDLLDASDRPVWTKTVQPTVEPGALWNDRIVLTLPRGYYRAKVTAWSGTPASSSILSQDERAMAVVDLLDPVPRGNYFGFAADAGMLSMRTAQLGAGWVAMPYDLGWHSVGWQHATAALAEQPLDAVVRLNGLPAEAAVRQAAYRQWAATTGDAVAAVLVKRSNAGRMASSRREPIRQWLGAPDAEAPAVLVEASELDAPVPATQPTTAPTSQAATRPSSQPDGVVFECLAGWPLPEDAEPELERWAALHQGTLGVGWWNLSVPGRAGSAYAYRPRIESDRRAPAAVQSPDLDPLLSASRLVRSMLIQHIAGADFACSRIRPFQPFESLVSPPDDCLHEYDHAPRPALAAWDWMTSLLNEARPVEWIDKPGDVRALAFEQPGGELVVAIWRPFGWTEQRLVLPGLAGQANVYDLFGAADLSAEIGNHLVIRVNELVRYVVVAAEAHDAALTIIENAEVSGP
ncbi:MAG: hypothetical protein JXA69_13290 [Phycisphaerae bacterium]|nr:hypothetical protein [Phycisphaerae bacterium]